MNLILKLAIVCFLTAAPAPDADPPETVVIITCQVVNVAGPDDWQPEPETTAWPVIEPGEAWGG